MTQSHLKTVLTAAALLVAASPITAMAADGAALYKTKTCSACHGKDAKTPIMPNYPKIAGQNAAYTMQQMKDIKSGARNNGQTASMKGIMHLVTDEEMQALSDYLATLAP
jgi:cytochrome c